MTVTGPPEQQMNFMLTRSPISFPLMSMASATTYDLHFRLEELDKEQARFMGRSVLVPQIDFKDYTCRAVIDWLDMKIQVAASTQARWVNDFIRAKTGKSLKVWNVVDPDDQEDSQQFRIRFQEAMLGDVHETMQLLRDKWSFLSEPVLAGIEFSVDLTPKVYSEEALAKLFGVIARTHLPSRDMLKKVDDLPRFTSADANGKLVTKKVMPLHNKGYPIGEVEKDQAPTYDSTYYVGKEGGPSMWRLMVKRIDKQNKTAGTFLKLDDKEKRVRLEVTLLESEPEVLGVRTLKDLAEFRYQTLNKSYFQFRLPTFLPPDESELGRQEKVEKRENRRLTKFLKTGVVGLEALDRRLINVRQDIRRRRKTPERVRTSSTLVIYEDLTRKVIQALRHLGERQRRSYERVMNATKA